MEEKLISKRLFMAIIGITFMFWIVHWGMQKYYSNKLKVQVCSHSSGVSVYIKLKNEQNFLINPDGQKNKANLICLAKFLPFYDKKIEYVVIFNNQMKTSIFKQLSEYYQIKNVLSFEKLNQTKDFNQHIEVINALEYFGLSSNNSIKIDNTHKQIMIDSYSTKKKILITPSRFWLSDNLNTYSHVIFINPVTNVKNNVSGLTRPQLVGIFPFLSQSAVNKHKTFINMVFQHFYAIE